jgi:sigma-B regulation protein RsbU (phosphoserine phosphatase)
LNKLLQAIDLSVAPLSPPKEGGLARAIQQMLVPSVAYQDRRVEAYGRTVPHDDLGGDLVDLVATGRDVIAYVADVSGHDLPACVLMGMLKAAMHYGLTFGQPLPALLGDINRLLPSLKEPNMYATLAGLRFDESNQVEYITAGHVPLLHYRLRQGDVVRCSMDQFPLGLFEQAGYMSSRVPFEPGDLFALVSDGVVETDDAEEEEFGLERLEYILCDYAGRPLPEIFDAALAAVTRHGTPEDDQTLLLVRALKG